MLNTFGGSPLAYNPLMQGGSLLSPDWSMAMMNPSFSSFMSRNPLIQPQWGMPAWNAPNTMNNNSSMLMQMVTVLLLSQLMQGRSSGRPGQTFGPGTPPPPPPGYRPGTPQQPTGFRPPAPPEQRPPAPVVQGPDKSMIDKNGFQLSGQAAGEILANPTQIKQIIQREIEVAAGTKDTSMILEKLTGTKIETGAQHIYKQRLSWDYYNHTVLPAIVDQYRKAYNLEDTPLQGRQQSAFTLGGAYFSNDIYRQIRQTPDQARNILREEMARLAGTNTAKGIVQKYVNDPRDHGANFDKWLNEDLDKMVKSLRTELNLP